MYRIVTIAREFGSGGASIAGALARKLGWKLLDNACVLEVARAARVDPAMAHSYDERIDNWLHRISKRALWRGGLERVPAVSDMDYFDSDTMAALTSELITHAAEETNCVIVGRGAQCILHGRKDVFHVFVYAEMGQKIGRVRNRVKSCADAEALIRSMDKARSDYVKVRFGCNWTDPHLYHLMISSTPGEDWAVSTILHAAGLRA
jgi:cytidylate kinase